MSTPDFPHKVDFANRCFFYQVQGVITTENPTGVVSILTVPPAWLMPTASAAQQHTVQALENVLKALTRHEISVTQAISQMHTITSDEAGM